MIEAKFLDMNQRQCYVYISKKYIFDWKDILIMNREHINYFILTNVKNEGARAKKPLFFTLFYRYGQNLQFFGPSTLIFEISLK